MNKIPYDHTFDFMLHRPLCIVSIDYHLNKRSSTSAKNKRVNIKNHSRENKHRQEQALRSFHETNSFTKMLNFEYTERKRKSNGFN
jgi:ABC-type transport system involved in cytochrome bd biosynthesis fused ATPase/permease subunit